MYVCAQVIVQRLEAESQEARQVLRAESAAREAAAANRHAAAMKEAKRIEARYASTCSYPWPACLVHVSMPLRRSEM